MPVSLPEVIYLGPVGRPGEFVDEVLTSPLGVTWLGVLEAGRDEYGGWQQASARSDPNAVSLAVERVGETSFGSLLQAAVFASVMESGPWMGTAPASIAAAYANAEARAPIAEAIVTRFLDEMYAPVDRARQQWFSDGHPWAAERGPLFGDFEHVYGAGEFTWAGLRTATEPPDEALVEMVAAWEFETGPVERWWMPVRDEARVFEIHGPADWARLVSDHPRIAAPHPGWELPGVNQHVTDLEPLLRLPNQTAARIQVGRHLVPDWRSVAGAVDGVHLSWAGFITTEGRIADLGDGAVTMLRYWFSERTLWLNDVFGEPRPAPDPHIDFTVGTRHHPPLAPRVPMTSERMALLLGRVAEG